MRRTKRIAKWARSTLAGNGSSSPRASTPRPGSDDDTSRIRFATEDNYEERDGHEANDGLGRHVAPGFRLFRGRGRGRAPRHGAGASDHRAIRGPGLHTH